MWRGTRLAGLVVLIAASLPGPARAQDSTAGGNIAEVFGHVLGMGPGQAAELADTTVPVNSPPYRYGDDPSSPATLSPTEAPWASPTGVGAAILTLPDDFVAPPVDASLGVSTTSGAGLVPGRQYAMFWSSNQGAMTDANMGNRWVNISFPTTTPGSDFWIPLSQFPGDTWGGFSRIPYFTYGPQPWALHLDQVSGGSLSAVPIDGAAFFINGVVVVLVPLESVLPPGTDPMDLRFSFAMHVHDGSFGGPPSSSSTITAVPPIPSGTRSEERTGLPVHVGPSVVGEEPAPSDEDTTPSDEDTTPSDEDTTPSDEDTTPSDEDTTPSDEDTTPSDEDTTPSTTGTSKDDGGDSSLIFIAFGLVGLGLIGGGFYLRFGRSTAASTTEPTPWPAVISGTSQETDTTDPGIVVGTKPDKEEGGADGPPPKIGIRGWKA